MNEKRYATRVGLFLVMGLVLIAVLMLSFSRGIGAFKPKYEVQMRTRSVSGLRANSAVFLAGVQIGNVRSIELDPAGKSVLVRLEILKHYPLPRPRLVYRMYTLLPLWETDRRAGCGQSARPVL